MPDTPADVLVADAGHVIGEARRAAGARAKLARVVEQDRIVEVLDDIAPRAHLGMVRVDVDQRPASEPLVAEGFRGVREDVAGVGLGGDLLDREFPNGLRFDVHGFSVRRWTLCLPLSRRLGV